MKRRDFCTQVAAAAAAAGALAFTGARPVLAEEEDRPTADVALIYQLQAAFHRAKTAQDLALMMSLWEPDAVLAIAGDPKSPYAGSDQLQAFWANSGSFRNKRFSLVPSYKTRIAVRGDQAMLYFECHDVADYDQPTRNIINDTFLSGTLRKAAGKWRFSHMTAGPSTPLSLDHYFA